MICWFFHFWLQSAATSVRILRNRKHSAIVTNARHNPQNLVEHLRQVPYLNGLSDQVLTDIAQSAIGRRYNSGEIIFLENEPSTGLYYLQSGWVKVIRSSIEGREQILRFFAPGETFNELGILADQPNPATAVALEPCEVWLVPHQTLNQLLRDHPEFAQRLIQNLADRITYLVGMVANLSLKPVISRLAHLLLDEAQGDIVSRPQWYTQSQLASRLGTVPDVVQRALSSLVADGVIELQRHQIRILDRAALEHIASE